MTISQAEPLAEGDDSSTGSTVLDWLLVAQCDLADGHEICARECFPLLALVAWY